MYSPELASKIALWRQKSAEGTMTIEEYREAIAELRAGRVTAAQSKAKPKKAAIDEDELLGGL